MLVHRKNSLAAWLPDLLGRAAQSSPEAAPRRAQGAGRYGEGADRATLHPPPVDLATYGLAGDTRERAHLQLGGPFYDG
jgi:hypothetical protein